MHVVLVGAEFEENLAVRYLQGALEHAGHKVASVVFNEAAEIEAAACEIARSGAQIAGFSMVFTYRAREFARVATRARELGFAGHIVAGGHFATLHAEALLREVPAFDSVGCGEGESILCSLAERLAELGQVEGLVWRQGDRIVRNAPAVKPPDLDVLPFPPRKSPMDRYLGVAITNILSSRGCSRSCAFCSIAAWHRVCGGDRLRLRAPARLADEMALLYGQGVRIFNFHDDNFVLDDKAEMIERLHALGAELARRGVNDPIAFAIKCRPDVVDPELFSLLKTMGMFRVFLGVEAGTAESLRRLGRGQTVTDNERALAILNELDIHTCFNLLVLNPDSTLEDLAANVAFLRKHPHNAMNFCRTEIYAGTPLESRLRRQGRLVGDAWGYDYVIADPRAQLAFEVLYPAFEARNYGDEGLHHLTMQIDYEQQLLRRFFGPQERLRRKTKKLIEAVNLNTCEHLERLIERLRKGATEADREALTAQLRAEVEHDNALLAAKVKALLEEIRTAPERSSRRSAGRGWIRAAATAGIAATLAAAGCREKSHPTEMVAAPTAPTSGPPPRSDDKDAGEDSAAETLPAGAPGVVKPDVSRQMLSLLTDKVVPPDIVEFEVWVGQDGRVTDAKLYRPKLSADAEGAILDKAKSLSFSDPAARGRRFLVYFSKEEIARGKADAAAPPPPPPTATHPKERIPPRPEMAPRPPPTRHTEMAPLRPGRVK